MESPSSFFFCGFNPATVEKVSLPSKSTIINHPRPGEWRPTIGWPHSFLTNQRRGRLEMCFTNKRLRIDGEVFRLLKPTSGDGSTFSTVASVKAPKCLTDSAVVSVSMECCDDDKLYVLWARRNDDFQAGQRYPGNDLTQAGNSESFSEIPRFGYVGVLDFDLKAQSDSALSLRPLDLQISVAQMACGKNHVLFLTNHGEVLVLGSNSRRQLGLENVFEANSPTPVEALEGVVVTSVAAGGWHSIALSREADVYLWGLNDRGQCGRPFFGCEDVSSGTPKFRRSVERKNVVDKTDSLDHSRDRRFDAKNDEEDDDSDFSHSPVSQTLPFPYTFDSEMIAIAAGSRHSLFLRKNETVLSCGSNAWGQLGRETGVDGLHGRLDDDDEGRLTVQEADWRPKKVQIEGRVTNIWAGWWSSFFLQR